MKLGDNVKPIGYLTANGPEIVRHIGESGNPLAITLEGEIRAVLQDIRSYERTQETLALLKVLALTARSVADGNVSPAADAFVRIRQRTARSE